jgi:phage N-6-adenine-methyltransferase
MTSATRVRSKKPSIQNYVTPWRIFRPIQDECFGGAECALDACADRWNTKAKRFYSINDNGLAQPWFDWTYYNPPYAEQRLWLEKAAREAQRGVRSAGLLKYAASELYWMPNTYEIGETEVYYGRISFDAPRGGLVLKTKHGARVFAEGETVDGSDFSNALVLMGPGFKPKVVRYRDSKSGFRVVATLFGARQ